MSRGSASTAQTYIRHTDMSDTQFHVLNTEWCTVFSCLHLPKVRTVRAAFGDSRLGGWPGLSGRI